MSLPSIFDYLPDAAPALVKLAKEDEKRTFFSRPVLKAALKGLAVTTIGGGMGYAGGKLLAQQLGPKIPPAALGGIGAVLAGGLMAARHQQQKKFKEILQGAAEGRED